MYTNISIYILQKGKINLKTQTHTCTASKMIYNRCAGVSRRPTQCRCIETANTVQVYRTHVQLQQ